MIFLNYTAKYILFFLIGIVVLVFLGSCGIWDPADARKVPANVDERVQKNLDFNSFKETRMNFKI